MSGGFPTQRASDAELWCRQAVELSVIWDPMTLMRCQYNEIFGRACPKLICNQHTPAQIANFMGPTWGPSGADRTQVGPMLAHEPCYVGTASETHIKYVSKSRDNLWIIYIYELYVFIHTDESYTIYTLFCLKLCNWFYGSIWLLGYSLG